MNIKSLVRCAVTALLFAALGWAQGELFDTVLVTFASPVKVNDTVVPAGRYEIRQVHSDGAAARILFVAQRGAVRFEASGATIFAS